MIAYASWTGTRRNLAAMREHGWRLLISSEGHHGPDAHVGWNFALDNGAFTSFQQKREWNADLFRATLHRLGPAADWVVVPDIVMGGLLSLERSVRWLDEVLAFANMGLIAVQNGIEPERVRGLLGPRTGLFVGGDTEFKLSTLQTWCNLAHERGCWTHVGRVNSARRIRACIAAGADSFDGTSPTRFAVTTPELTRALPTLPVWGSR